MLAPTPLATGSFVTVDIETTGCRPGTSSILEIGAARIRHGAIVDTFTTLVRPTEPIPAVVERLTGITEAMVSRAPSVADAVSRFAAFAENAVIVAHNHRFDLGFLDFEAERALGAPFPRPVLDTLCLARRLHPEITRNNLRELARFYDVSTVPNHRALPDALATAEILVCMLPELQAEGIVTAGDTARLCGIAECSDLAAKLPLATHMPPGPGVYLFRGEYGSVIYVGRARDLRSKVRSHFYAADVVTDSPAALAESVEYIECVSQLDAEILEARLRYRYRPDFNRNTTNPRTPIFIHLDTASPYPTVQVTKRRYRTGETLGPLTSQWAATTVADTLSRVYGLRRCRRTVADCRAYRCRLRELGTCDGPALFSEGVEAYRSRVDRCLQVLRGDDSQFRSHLQTMRDRSARGEEYEQAAYYRDALRALDRTSAGLAMASRARRLGVSVVIEGATEAVTLSVLVNGWRFTTLRLSAAEVAQKAARDALDRTLQRAVQRASANPPITPKRLEEMAIIDAYRQQHAPLIVKVGDDVPSAVSEIVSATRRLFRIPRRHHGDVSAG
jgi:DNA polymerase-3 subunit epsilon